MGLDNVGKYERWLGWLERDEITSKKEKKAAKFNVTQDLPRWFRMSNLKSVKATAVSRQSVAEEGRTVAPAVVSLNSAPAWGNLHCTLPEQASSQAGAFLHCVPTSTGRTPTRT